MIDNFNPHTCTSDNMEPNIKYTSYKESTMIHDIKEHSFLI
jgi:hypothetical protein